MGLLIDDEVLELLHSEEEIEEQDWVDKLVELYNSEEVKVDDSLMHYGVAHDENPPGRGSGRYPFGSGDRILQRNWDEYSRYLKLKNSIDPDTGKNYTESKIAGLLGYYQTDKDGNPRLDNNGNPIPSTSLLRAKTTIQKNYIRQEGYVKEIKKLDSRLDPDTGKPYTNTKIGEILGINESSVRNYRNSESASQNASAPEKAANKLKEIVDKKGMIDVGRGAELSLDVSSQGLKVALEMLKDEGYQVAPVWTDQVGGVNGNKTIINVLYKPGMDYIQDVVKHMDQIKPIEDPDGESTLTKLGMRDPVRVDLDRVKVRFAEQGGIKKDGVIEIRAKVDDEGRLVAACDDLSLGNAKYAQVRIATEGDHYIKGMAVYNTDLPKDVDILVNSNKSETKGKEGALKEMTRLTKNGKDLGVDPDNPFGATVYQSTYKGKDGKDHLSAINIVGDIYGVDQHKEGAWDEWSRNLPAQFLSKQSETLIKQQLKLKVQEKEAEYKEILSLNNPVVKKQMLKDFADGCDAAAVDLKAAPLPGQRVHVLLPLTTIKPNEVYAPNYDNGQTLALIRYPHTGAWEIPIVKVNNRNKEAKSFLEDSRGQAKDAIGVNHRVAEILSGADFDGDTVTVIPMTRKGANGDFERIVNIKGLGNGQSVLPGLENGFDPSAEYPGTDSQGNPKPGVHMMTKREKGIEMGKISNLITDMSLLGCDDPMELSRAVRYSMVVIDAEKHKLDYKKAEKDYNISELREKYQNGGGVATLVSRAGSEIRNAVPQRQAWSPSAGHIDKETGERVGNTIDFETGEKIYKLAPHRFYTTFKEVRVKDPETGKYLKNPDGSWKKERVKVENERMMSLTKMDYYKDATELLSTNPSNKELLYRDYANKMKSMANDARKEWLAVPKMEMNPDAKKEYKAEVDSLNKKYIDAKKNAPRERQAQIIATQIINSRLDDNPDKAQDKEWVKRIKGQALIGARSRAGAQKKRVTFTEKEWEAINKGAVSETRLTELLKNADADNYRQLATPKTSKISASTAARIEALLNAGWTREDIKNAGYASIETIKKVEAGQVETK